jgi:hypothetical protein
MVVLLYGTVAEKSKLFEQSVLLIRALLDPERLKKADLRVPDFGLHYKDQPKVWQLRRTVPTRTQNSRYRNSAFSSL